MSETDLMHGLVACGSPGRNAHIPISRFPPKSELGTTAGGLSAAGVGAGVRRIESRRNQDAKFCTRLNDLERQLLESETNA